MTTQPVPQALAEARAEFDALITDIRPELHRYCARMTGSVIDGEDVVQEALAKAYYAMSTNPPVTNLRSWLFRIAHNKAIDHLRRREVRQTEPLEDAPLIDTGESEPLEARELAAVAMSRLLELTAAQRSCVFLKDVMEYSLAEISELHDTSVTAVKATLHRGRARLRALAARAETLHPKLPILAPLHPAVVADHHRTDGVASLNRGDVEALDPVRDARQGEHPLQLVERVGGDGGIFAVA